jgi:hypothetical protein
VESKLLRSRHCDVPLAQPPQEFQLRHLVRGDGKRVVRPEVQFGRDREGRKGVAPVCLDPGNVGKGREGRIGIDEIGDVVLV